MLPPLVGVDWRPTGHEIYENEECTDRQARSSAPGEEPHYQSSLAREASTASIGKISDA
jgi:hypothetical protein